MIVTHDFPPMQGGIAQFLDRLADGLSEGGHQVLVLAEAPSQPCEIDRRPAYNLLRYPRGGRIRALSLALRIAAHCLTSRPRAILMGHVMSTRGLAVTLVSKVFQVPYAVLCHGADLGLARISKTDGCAVRGVLRHADMVIANSAFTARVVRERASCGRPLEILNPGVDTDRFNPHCDTAQVTSRYGLSGRRAILSVGRLVPRKNHAAVLHALPSIIEKVPDAVYLIAGEGPEKERLRALAATLGVNDFVVFAGFVPDADLPALYCASECLVMPSLESAGEYEGFGIVFVEAGACGKPVIGSRSGGIADAVVDGETGLLLDPANAENVKEAVLHLLENADVARRIGAKARRRAVEKLSWDRVCTRLAAYLKTTKVTLWP